MRVYLLRHFESEKNRKATLSKLADDDSLTEQGRKRCISFAQALHNEVRADALEMNTIVTSSAARAIETAKIIASTLEIDDVRVCSFLRSTWSGPYAGLSSRKIRSINKTWYDSFQLYKAGLFNQYQFDQGHLVIGAESKRSFERRVVDGLLATLDGLSGTAVLVVANRSSLTAILLHFARKYYGYVQIDLGSVTVLEQAANGDWKFLKVNSRSPKLRAT